MIDIPAKAKAWIAALTSLAVFFGGAVIYVGSLQTDVEAQEHVRDFDSYVEKQYKADRNQRLDVVDGKIDDIDEREFQEAWTEKEQVYWDKKREKLEDKKVCIKKDEC